MPRHRIGVLALTAAAASLYCAYALRAFAAFKSSAYDLVIFDQAVRSYAHFHAPISALKGVHNGFGPGFSVLGDHWSPILALLAPLYWIHDGPETLLVAQALLLAAAIPPLWVYTRRSLGPVAAYCVAGTYAISWPVAETVGFDFHEAAFVPVLTAVLLERHQAGRRLWVVAAALALLVVKEDMGLLVAGIGLFFLTRRADRRLGACFVVGGLAHTLLAVRVLIPAAGGDADYYWAYGAFGPDAASAVWFAVTHPLAALAQLGTPPVKLLTMLLLPAMVLFVALGSPLLVAVLPLLAERMMSSVFPNWWVPEYHYNAFLVIVVFCAGVDAMRRLRGRVPRTGRWAVPWAVAALALTVGTLPFFAFGDISSHRTRVAAARAAVAAVPDGAVVEAANNLAPALSARTRTLLWDREPRWASWVVADVVTKTFPFKSVDEQRARVETLLNDGYRTVLTRGGYMVLTRTPA